MMNFTRETPTTTPPTAPRTIRANSGATNHMASSPRNNSFLNKITNSMNAKKKQISQSLPKLNHLEVNDEFLYHDSSHAATPSPTDLMVNKFMSQLEQHKFNNSNNSNTSGSEDGSISDSTNSPIGDCESSDDILSNVLFGSSYNNYRTSRSWSHLSHFNAISERNQSVPNTSITKPKQPSPSDDKVKKLTKRRKKNVKKDDDSSSGNEKVEKKASKWFKAKFESSGSESEASDRSQDSSKSDSQSDSNTQKSSLVQDIPDKREVMLLFLMQHVCREYNPDPSFFSNMCAQLVENGYLSDNRYSDQIYLKQLCKEFTIDVIQNWPIAFTDHAGESKLKRSVSVGSFLHGLTPNDDLSRMYGTAGHKVKGLSPVTLPFFDYMFYSNSRFLSDFQQKFRIGKGAFGSVYKAKHRVDGHEYAIKKVKFSFRNAQELERTYTKVIREVKLLATLDHVNIVRYNQAWFEPSYKDSDYSSEEEEEEEEEEEGCSDSAALSDHSEHNELSPARSKVNSQIVRECFASKPSVPAHSDTSTTTQFKFDEETDPVTPCNQSQITLNSPVFECYTSDEDACSPPKKGTSSANTNPIIDIPPTPDGISFLEYAVQKKLDVTDQARPKENLTVPPVDNQSVKQAVKTMLADMFNESKNKFEMFMFIQMQLCKQNTLQDYMNNEERVKNNVVDYDQSMDFFKQLADGVMHIHEKSLIHRDLKPKNIFITTNNVIKIGDFGLAKSAKENIVHTKTSPDHEKQLVKLNSSKLATSPDHTYGVGTFFYASPEQYEGTSYDEKADIFSLGIILFELLHPFGSGHERALTLNELRAGVIPAGIQEQYPEELELVKRCIQKVPAQRPTAMDVYTATVNIIKRREKRNSNSLFGVTGQERQMYRHDVQQLLQEKDDEIMKLRQELDLLRKQVHKLPE